MLQLAPVLLQLLGSSAEGPCGIPRAQGAHPEHGAGEEKGTARGADPAEHWGCPQLAKCHQGGQGSLEGWGQG